MESGFVYYKHTECASVQRRIGRGAAEGKTIDHTFPKFTSKHGALKVRSYYSRVGFLTHPLTAHRQTAQTPQAMSNDGAS